MTRWRPETNQVDRWTATALLWVEAGFNKIRGYADLPKLLTALEICSVAVASVPSLPLRGTAPAEQTLSTEATATSQELTTF